MTSSSFHPQLRIAQIAPLFESVPPQLYGGTERVVSYLTEDLVRRGHAVTLFASGDSATAAELIAVCDRAIRLDPAHPDAFALHALMLERVCRHASSFDVIHFHTDGLHLPVARRCPRACSVTTLHGRLDIPGLAALYREFNEQPLISISAAQRRPMSGANWLATVYHGLPPQIHTATETPGQYLAFLGRIAPEKGIERAIEIARRSEIPLKIAAKIDRADQQYYDTQVACLIDGSQVDFIGEITEVEKTRFLGDAIALLFPIDWPEPFGLTMIEAMACGTPVIGFRRGSVPEIIDEGVTGFMVDDLDAAVACVARAPGLSRKRCREQFEHRFQVAHTSQGYCDVYALARQRTCPVVS
jgi:glycosyltransferase involved in cell wall biosynthesis